MELLSGMFNFDTKLVRTMRDLFVPPGLVIRAFNANQRARYVHPLRLYLFTSVLFFLFLAWTTARLGENEGPVLVVNSSGPDGHTTDGLTLNLGANERLNDSTLTALSALPELTNEAIDSALIAQGATPSLLHRILVRMAVNMSGNSLRKDEFVQRMFGTFSKLLFVLLPLFALLLKLLYWRTGAYYTEHLVFALYVHTVAFLFIGIGMALGAVFGYDRLSELPIFLSLIYLVWAARTVHQRTWANTILRMLLLILLYCLLLAIGLAASAVIGALAP